MSFKKNLTTAKKDKKDEFYTQLTDIEKELNRYKDKFKDKVVLMPCDDPELIPSLNGSPEEKASKFWVFMHKNFKRFGLKKIIATHFDPKYPAYIIEYEGGDDLNIAQFTRKNLEGNGDFRSDEIKELFQEADIIVTNPPFSLFKEFVAQLMNYQNQFLILGNVNAIAYKEIFKLIKENKVWLGETISSGDREFGVPSHYPMNASGFRVDENGNRFLRVKGVRWFTNLKNIKFVEKLELFRKYSPIEYPKYDNYNAININMTKNIPFDYKGEMGVPITFLDKYNPQQFEITGILSRSLIDEFNKGYPFVNGKKTYARVLIRRKI